MRARRTCLVERIETYLNTLNRVCLYRDDGIAMLPNSSGFKGEKLKKQTHTFFKSMGLRVPLESPLVITKFLELNLNLNDISYMPYIKPNKKIMYVNINLSHPKTLIKLIPIIINERLIKRSSKKEISWR